MNGNTTRVFSLAEANELVPTVAEFTEETVQMINNIRQQYGVAPGEAESALPDEIVSEVEEVLQDWSERVEELGAYPKGFFTVDFQSIDPELLYCWCYGEEEILYAHRIWENFSYRKPLAQSPGDLANPIKWIN